jgi:hypothetical protein
VLHRSRLNGENKTTHENSHEPTWFLLPKRTYWYPSGLKIT